MYKNQIYFHHECYLTSIAEEKNIFKNIKKNKRERRKGKIESVIDIVLRRSLHFFILLSLLKKYL